MPLAVEIQTASDRIVFGCAVGVGVLMLPVWMLWAKYFGPPDVRTKRIFQWTKAERARWREVNPELDS